MASAISAMEIEGAKDTQYTAAPTRGLGRDAPKTLKFKDINYTVTITEYENPDSCFESGKSCQKPIVKGVSGEVKGGQMLCCLGPSGSGKTSLIHIISGRIKSTSNQSHIVSGEVLVDNQMMTGTAFRRMSGLVTQEDIFNGHLTVYETLHYAAGLILPADIRDARVNEVIELLQLEQCRNTFIGDDADPYIKGISGGEKRRLAIAMEILDPTISLLMADEPTSGLDAAAAQNVINVMRTLADDGLSVITTLHQPRVTIMNKFDLLMIISGGKSIYYGSIADYIPYIQNHLNIKIPEHESPYEILLDALNPAIAKESQAPIGLIQNDQEKTEVGELLANAYENSPLGQSEMAKITTSSKGDTVVLQEEEKGFCEKVGHWVNCTWILLLRTFLIKLRDPICLMTQVSSGIIMGLIFGALYWDVYDKSTNSFAILDAQMCIVMAVLMAVWLPYDVTLTFPKERRIFLRERKAGLYTTSQFYLARITADAPAHTVSALIMALIIWGMAGLQLDLGAFCGIMVYAIVVGGAMMQLIGAISRTFEEANIYMMIVMMMSMMLGTGFVREVPSWLEWARDISIMGVTADLAMYLEFKDVNSKYGTKEEIFEEYGVLITNQDQFVDGMMVLFYILLVTRILCYLAVKFMWTGRTFEEDMRD